MATLHTTLSQLRGRCRAAVPEKDGSKLGVHGRRYSTAGTKAYFLRLGDHCKAEAALHYDNQPEGKPSILLRAYAAALAACGSVKGKDCEVTTEMILFILMASTKTTTVTSTSSQQNTSQFLS